MFKSILAFMSVVLLLSTFVVINSKPVNAVQICNGVWTPPDLLTPSDLICPEPGTEAGNNLVACRDNCRADCLGDQMRCVQGCETAFCSPHSEKRDNTAAID